MLREKLCVTSSACLLPHARFTHFRWVSAARLSRAKITELNGRIRKYTCRGALKRAVLTLDVAFRDDKISSAFIDAATAFWVPQ
jgi:hypothetical protein